MIRWCTVPEKWCATDGRTDRKSDTERWVPQLKIISDNATGVLIVPNWPSQLWFTILQQLLLIEAFIILPNANNLYLPNPPDLKDPFFRNLELMVCLVSGKALAGRGFRPDYEILVRRYGKIVCKTFKEMV